MSTTWDEELINLYSKYQYVMNKFHGEYICMGSGTSL